ncbi:hypothetical protein C7B64_23900 [Merismopedia glauca CCAP 1448/3]|uniref:Transposase IS4-like domain-containing protein n=2 Tax=Merismopedia TaxID=53402 RepID=A0A2T1BWT0_9CYAN|nr:hypothetical protein C7B64_23900 [Merismopedia glauca CCAP 1448/3]
MSLPASLFLEMFEQLVNRLKEKPNPTLALQNWQQEIHQRWSAVWIADGSTLERLQRHLGQLQGQPQNPLAGKMMMVVEVFSHRRVAAWYDCNAQRSEMTWWQELLELLPSGGLVVIDLGFFGFEWFDAMSAARKYFLTRQKQKVGYKVVKTLSCGRYYRDEIIQMGLHHTHPCRSQVRQVSVLWGKTWHRYLTNILDPQMLSAPQVCQLYHCRWQIEDAFLLTKRLLGLAYLWVGGRNGVQIQLYPSSVTLRNQDIRKIAILATTIIRK